MSAIELLKEAKEQRSTKLAPIEQKKSEKDFDELYKKLELYAQNGYASISEDDKDFFLKSFGIFDRPATPEKFMLRIRIPGGKLDIKGAKAIAEVASKYAQGYIDITTRMQIELRFISIEDMPKILSTLEDAGITTYQTGVDNFRNILCDPLDGLAKDSIIECSKIIDELQSLFLKNPEWITTLPRKFNTGVSGSRTNRCNIYGQDCAFVLAKKNDTFGFNVYLGGKVGSIAKNANVFLNVDQVSRFFYSLISLFKEYGFRDNRNKNRLKFLIDSVGMENFVDAIKEHAKDNSQDAGENLNDGLEFDTNKPIEQKDGSYAVLFPVPSGIFSSDKFYEVIKLASIYGNGEIRFTVEQNLYVLGILDLKSFREDESYKKLFSNINSFNTNLVACAGSEHCPYGVIEGKPDAIRLANQLAEAFPTDKNIRMYWSACPKGCGIHSSGDIGFVGTKKSVDGKIELAVDVYAGGKLDGEGAEGEILLKGVLLTELFSTIKPIIKDRFLGE